MCQETMSTKNTAENEKMDDVDLCTASKSSSSTSDGEVVVDKATKENSSEEEISSYDADVNVNVNAADQIDNNVVDIIRPKNFPWWRGGGIIPYSGKDLGVHTKSLEDNANCYELWWMSYMNPLLDLGSRKILDSNDVGIPSSQDRAERSYTMAKDAWDKQVVLCKLKNEPLLIEIDKQKQLEHELEEQERLSLSETSSTAAAVAAAVSSQAAANKKKTSKKKKKEIELKEPSIALSLIYSFGTRHIILALIYQIISSLLAFVPVLILNDMVQYFEYYNFNKEEIETNPDFPKYNGMAPPWVEVFGLGLIPFIVSLLQTRHNAIMAHCGVFVRTAVSTMLYRKALTVSAAGRAMTSTGQVVNMMSNDTMQLQRFLQFAGFTIIAPLQIIIALALIYQQVGNAMWVGVAYMFFLMPINMWVFSVVGKMRRKVLKHSDSRVKMMNEILTGIRIIKFYAWERPFGKEVSRVRAKEMDALTKMSYTVAVGFSIILLSTPIVQPIFVFVTYVNIQDQPLTAATAFTTVALFNLMRFPFAFMPMGLLQYIQSRISLHRLERYLALPELNQYVVDGPPPTQSKSIDGDIDDDTTSYGQSGSISILDGSFGWIDPDGPAIKPIQEEERSKKKEKLERKERRASRKSSMSRRKSEATINTENEAGGGAVGSDNASSVVSSADDASSVYTNESGSSVKTPTITLRNITTHIKSGSLVAVVGSVGSGKSSLLSAILGEMESINDSKVYVPRNGEEEKEMDGFASYCTQSPWVINDTLRGNILFGREYIEKRYNEVLSVCALTDDIAVLPAGDQTEIGTFILFYLFHFLCILLCCCLPLLLLSLVDKLSHTSSLTIYSYSCSLSLFLPFYRRTRYQSFRWPKGSCISSKSYVLT
ncbi:MAG: ABC-type multidrug transport system fused ATPase/permease subunit [Bacillariaceae sp.]|jgi:ABC-type multidrug transport system fused ATPase/permease subunit